MFQPTHPLEELLGHGRKSTEFFLPTGKKTRDDSLRMHVETTADFIEHLHRTLLLPTA